MAKDVHMGKTYLNRPQLVDSGDHIERQCLHPVDMRRPFWLLWGSLQNGRWRDEERAEEGVVLAKKTAQEFLESGSMVCEAGG